MNVSLNRKIHIIALPHGTRNVCLSADQSVTMVCQPSLGRIFRRSGYSVLRHTYGIPR